MNYSLYLFGTNKGIYIQYPSDGEDSFLQPLCQNVKGTQLTVYRKEALSHYAFLRQLTSDSSNVFGMCLVTNGLYFDDIKVLYQVFDDIFSRIVFDGKILKIRENGKISFVNDNFAIDKSVIEHTQIIVDEVVQKILAIHALHSSHNFSGLVSSKTVTIEERNSVILEAINKNNVVHIYSNDNSNSPINYVEQTISNLYNENGKLKSDYSKLQSQKKQLQVVLILAVILVCAGVGIYLLTSNLNITRRQLDDTNTELSATLDELSETRMTIEDQAETLANNALQISNLERRKWN